VTHYNYSISESCYNNTANNTISCVNQSIQTVDYVEHVPYTCWQKVDSIPVGTNDYKIDADISMAKCADGNLGYRIDWIPSLEVDTGKKLVMNDWAWWNSSYNNRMGIDISGFSVKTFFYINGSNGVNINGTVIYPVASTTTGVVSLYYNSATDYVIVENDTYVQYQIMSASANISNYWKLDEASGTNAKNEVNTNSNGTATGTTIVTGKVNNARKFTGVSGDKVDVGNLNGFDNFTISMWIKKNVATGYTASSIIGSQGGLPNRIIRIDFVTTDILQFDIESDDSNYLFDKAASTPITDTNWHFITVTRADATVHIYIDRVDQTLTTTSSGGSMIGQNINTGTTYQIGQIAGASQYFNGVVDDVGIWNRPLSSTEIDQLYYNYLSTTSGNIVKFENNNIDNESAGRQAI
jgi:hypothetical protein